MSPEPIARNRTCEDNRSNRPGAGGLSFDAAADAQGRLGGPPVHFHGAAVADQRELEIELGYFTREQSKGREYVSDPKPVLNYGSGRTQRLSAKRNLTGDIDVVDAGLFLKAVLKEGLLQEKPGVPDVVFFNAALKRRGTE
jgi:hypothetical protein